MKATTLILSLCMLVLSMVGCTSAKVGVVQPERLFQDSASGQAGIEHLRQIEKGLQEQLAIAQKYIEKDPKNESLRAYLQTVFQGYQQAVAAEQQSVMESVNTQMETALTTLREEDGYAVLLNAEITLSTAQDADVTEAVLAEMNANPLTFERFVIEKLIVPAEVMKSAKK